MATPIDVCHVRAGARMRAGRDLSVEKAAGWEKSRQMDVVTGIGRVKLGGDAQSGLRTRRGAWRSIVWIVGGSCDGMSEKDSATVDVSLRTGRCAGDGRTGYQMSFVVQHLDFRRRARRACPVDERKSRASARPSAMMVILLVVDVLEPNADMVSWQCPCDRVESQIACLFAVKLDCAFGPEKKVGSVQFLGFGDEVSQRQRCFAGHGQHAGHGERCGVGREGWKRDVIGRNGRKRQES